LSGLRSAEWLDRLEVEHDNLRAALRWSLDTEEAELGLRMGAALWWFWYVHGHLSQGRRWLEGCLSLRSPGQSRTRASALEGAGWQAMWQGQLEDAKALLQEALALFRELKDEEGVASALVYLGAVGVLGQQDDIPVPVLLEEATKLRPKIKDLRTLGTLLLISGLVAAMRGDLDRSKALIEESLALYREVGDVSGINHSLFCLGLVTLASRDYDKACALLREDLRISWESDHKVTIQSSPEDWVQTPGEADWIQVDVDTRSARFPATPVYVTSLYGRGGHWDTMPLTSIYEASATGFRVYVRHPDGRPLSPQTARDSGWYIGWIG
jgi:tetratricopeptide (TPR) repeat protein